MIYAANLQSVPGPAKYQQVPFSLPRQMEWAGRARAVSPDIVLFQDLVPTLPLLAFGSESSTVLPAFPEAIKPWQDPGVSTVRSFELQVSCIKQIYDLRRPPEVTDFLQAHSFLVPLLLEAREKITQYFGESSQVLLELISDPEVQGSVELFGYIVTNLSSEDAGNRLRQFDQEWFLVQVSRTKGLLNFDIDFQ